MSAIYKTVCINSLQTSSCRCGNYYCPNYLRTGDRAAAMVQGKAISYTEEHRKSGGGLICKDFVEYHPPQESLI